jgi:hypothetical protein
MHSRARSPAIRESGIMESWNNGILELWRGLKLIIPVFLYSNIPIPVISFYGDLHAGVCAVCDSTFSFYAIF